MNKLRRAKRRVYQGKDAIHDPKKNKYHIKKSLCVFIIALSSLAIGSYFLYDFYKRYSLGEYESCHRISTSGCLSTELFLAGGFIIYFFLGIFQIYVINWRKPNA
jgi:hypothetical protein